MKELEILQSALQRAFDDVETFTAQQLKLNKQLMKSQELFTNLNIDLQRKFLETNQWTREKAIPFRWVSPDGKFTGYLSMAVEHQLKAMGKTMEDLFPHRKARKRPKKR